jgi:hypothetical protein
LAMRVFDEIGSRQSKKLCHRAGILWRRGALGNGKTCEAA